MICLYDYNKENETINFYKILSIDQSTSMTQANNSRVFIVTRGSLTGEMDNLFRVQI